MAATRGYSLVEMLMVMAITLILLSYSLPSFTHLLKAGRAATAINWIISGIQYTRHSAITLNELVTICPSKDGIDCSGKWHQGTLVFTDRNADARVNGKDRILKRFHYPEENSTLTWRAFRNRQYLQMTPLGFTRFQNGNFVYCSADQNPRYSRQIIINMQGRVRKSYDKDGDGIIDDSRGKNLRC